MNTNKGETGKRNPPDAGCHTGRNIFQPVEWTSSPATLAPPPATARHRPPPIHVRLNPSGQNSFLRRAGSNFIEGSNNAVALFRFNVATIRHLSNQTKKKLTNQPTVPYHVTGVVPIFFHFYL